MHTLKLICITNFSSLGLFSFSSTFISYHQLLTADDSWYGKNFTWIFMYPLKLKHVPNFSSLGWFSFSSAVNNCYQLLTTDQLFKIIFESWILILVLKLVSMPSFTLIGWLGAVLESVTPDRQTPSEDRANSAMLSWARAWVGQLQTTFKKFWF